LATRKFVPSFTQEPAYCVRFIDALLTGRSIAAMEPDLRAGTETDPQLRKWRKCDYATPEQMQTKDPTEGFNGLWLLGGPPFRYYQINIDGISKNGKEDLLYHEMTRGDLKTGTNGYTWVDLEGCVIKGGAPVTRSEKTPENLHAIDLVARYQGE
jgi:hypothetical protein